MATSAAIDHRLSILAGQGRVDFWLSCRGHESVATFAPYLTNEDFVYPHYRDRALCLARGASIQELVADAMGLLSGPTAGRSLPGHFSFPHLNIVSLASPVGSNCLSACGTAWALKRSGSDAVVLVLLGEASTRQGTFLESLMQAVNLCLPVVFVIHNNGYGISTPTAGQTAVDLGMVPPQILIRCDARDACETSRAASTAFEKVRKSGGPVVVELSLDRLDSHSSNDDQRRYRENTEIRSLADPVSRLGDHIVAAGFAGRSHIIERLATIQSEVDTCFQGLSETKSHEKYNSPTAVGGESRPTLNRVSPSVIPTVSTTYAAVRFAIKHLLDSGSFEFVYGQDVGPPFGGVFGITKALGEGRALNAPLAESTIIGTATGMAISGHRIIAELQFVDFAASCWSELTQQAATLRWRSNGGWTCPFVVLVHCGNNAKGGGIWHNMSGESDLCRAKGLLVCAVGSPSSMASITSELLSATDPSVVLVPKSELRRPWTEAHQNLINFGNQRPRATLIVWSSAVFGGISAAMQMDPGSPIDVYEITFLNPLVLPDAIYQSAARSRCVLIVNQDGETASLAHSVANVLRSRLSQYCSVEIINEDDSYVAYVRHGPAQLTLSDRIVSAVASLPLMPQEGEKYA